MPVSILFGDRTAGEIVLTPLEYLPKFDNHPMQLIFLQQSGAAVLESFVRAKTVAYHILMQRGLIKAGNSYAFVCEVKDHQDNGLINKIVGRSCEFPIALALIIQFLEDATKEMNIAATGVITDISAGTIASVDSINCKFSGVIDSFPPESTIFYPIDNLIEEGGVPGTLIVKAASEGIMLTPVFILEEALDNLFLQRKKQREDIVILPTSHDMLKLLTETLLPLQSSFAQLDISMQVSKKLQDKGNMEHKSCPLILTPKDESRLVSLAYNCAPSAGMRILPISSMLTDNWFAHWHDQESTVVVSLSLWKKISDLPMTALVAYQTVLQLLRMVNPEYSPGLLFHEDVRGCLFDFCQRKPDINFKLRTGDICPECREKLSEMGFQVEPILRMLDTVRQIALSS